MSSRGRATTRAIAGGALLVALNAALVAACLPGWPGPEFAVGSTAGASPGQQIVGATGLPVLAEATASAKASQTAGSAAPKSTPSAAPSAVAEAARFSLSPLLPEKTFVPYPPPWLAWRPSGRGSVWIVDLPAPWNEGPATTENVDIYTPPGYDPHGSRRYPTLYEAPFDYSLWDSSIHFKSVLDSLIDQGTIPPMIVVMINAWRAPIYDTECVNSVDGRQWMDTFISKTVVSYVDANYRTDSRPEARGVFGFSQGGYCAAILALRHPTVFTTSIPFSGYFRAGIGDESAKLPFCGDAGAIADASPVLVAPGLPSDARRLLYFIVVAQHREPFFGTGATEFEGALQAGGYDYRAVDSTIGHGWEQVRRDLPGAFQAWGRRMVALGVFSG